MKIKEYKITDKYWDLARELKKKYVERQYDNDTKCSWHFWNGPQRPGKENVKTDQRKNRDYPYTNAFNISSDS